MNSETDNENATPGSGDLFGDVGLESLKRAIGAIYLALGTHETDCTKWAEQISAMRADSEILDWLEAHGISVRIQANARQSFAVPSTREAIRFEMTSGNVESLTNTPHEPRP